MGCEVWGKDQGEGEEDKREEQRGEGEERGQKGRGEEGGRLEERGKGAVPENIILPISTFCQFAKIK